MGSVGAVSSKNKSSIKLIDDHKLHKIDFDGGYVKYILYHEEQGDNLYIDELHTDIDKRGQGVGTKILDNMKSVADKSNMTIELSAFPFGPNRMSIDELIGWYEKRGFVHQGANKMIYTPKGK